MRTVKLNDKEYTLKYTMRTAIAYERKTGKSALAFEDIFSGKTEPIVSLAEAMLEGQGAPEIEDLSWGDVDRLMAETINEMKEFFSDSAEKEKHGKQDKEEGND